MDNKQATGNRQQATGNRQQAGYAGPLRTRQLELCLQEEGVEVELFDFLSGPFGPSQELQAGFDTRIVIEAADIDDASKLLPTVVVDELFE